MQDSATHQAATETVADRFNQLANRWAEHCNANRFSSKMNDYLDSDAYREIVKLGPPAIPYIMQRYRNDKLPWGFALDDITGLHMIKDRNRFDPNKVKQDWLQWWAQQSAAEHSN